MDRGAGLRLGGGCVSDAPGRSALEAARSALTLFCAGRLADAYTIAETLEGPGTIALPPDLVDRVRKQNPALLRAGTAVEQAQVRTEVAKKDVDLTSDRAWVVPSEGYFR